MWTGREVLVVGGEPEAWCPPGADCIDRDFEPLADGAAYDPAAGSWREIADALVAFSSNASAVVVDGAVYVLASGASHRPGGERGFLRYLIADDLWERLPTPPFGDVSYHLVEASGRVVAYTGTDEVGERPDLIFDGSTGDWDELPPDPLSPSFDRNLAVVGDQVYLFAKDLVTNPGSDRPSLARVARLDLSSGGEWQVLADSEILGTWSSVTMGAEIVFPRAGEADGGEVNNWGRSYPYGGIFDTETDTWFALPDPARDDGFSIAGVLGSDAAAYLDVHGAVLDMTRDSWITIPDLSPAQSETFNRTIVAAGTELFAFGGETWVDGNGVVLDTTYLWVPPR